MKVQKRFKQLTYIQMLYSRLESSEQFRCPWKKLGQKTDTFRKKLGQKSERSRNFSGNILERLRNENGNFLGEKGTNPDISRNFFGENTGKKRKTLIFRRVSEFFPNFFRVFSEIFPTLIHICSENSPSTVSATHDFTAF